MKVQQFVTEELFFSKAKIHTVEVFALPFSLGKQFLGPTE